MPTSATTTAWVLLVLSGCGGGAAIATEDAGARSGEGPHACRIEGWVADPDPAGLNVRAAPGRDAAIIGTLPGFVEAERGFGVPVRVDAAQDGWFRVEAGEDDPERSGLPPRPVHRGPGWVAANMIRFQLPASRGFAAPGTSGQVLVELGQDGLTEMGAIERVLDCRDEWVQVDFRLHYRRDPASGALIELPSAESAATRRAWFQEPCANQETTCERP